MLGGQAGPGPPPFRTFPAESQGAARKGPRSPVGPCGGQCGLVFCSCFFSLATKHDRWPLFRMSTCGECQGGAAQPDSPPGHLGGERKGVSPHSCPLWVPGEEGTAGGADP